MTAAYRGQPLRCPACATWLDPAQVGEAIIDACPGCGAIWVDWFDGDLPAMARGAPEAAPVGGGRGDMQCPHCKVALDEEQALDPPVELYRCGQCAGALVPRGSIQAIAAAEEIGAQKPEATGLGRLVEILRRWLG